MPAEVRQSSLGTKPSYSGFCGECIWFTPRNPFMAKEDAETRVEEHNALWHYDELAVLEEEAPEQIEQRKRGTGAWHRHTRNWPGPTTGWTPGC